MSNSKDILALLQQNPAGMRTESICKKLNKSPQELGDEFERLLNSAQLLGFAGLWFDIGHFKALKEKLLQTLEEMHNKFPSTTGHEIEKVIAESGLKLEGKPLDRILTYLDSEGDLDVHGEKIRRAGFHLKLTARQRKFIDRIKQELASETINTPSAHQLSLILHVPMQAVEEVIKLGAQARELIVLEDGVLYTQENIEAIKIRIVEVTKGKPFEAGGLRDKLETSRRYIIPLLEHLDSVGFTRRDGDERVVI